MRRKNRADSPIPPPYDERETFLLFALQEMGDHQQLCEQLLSYATPAYAGRRRDRVELTFYSRPWCGFCSEMKYDWENAKDRDKSGAVWRTVNLDRHQTIARRLNITQVPTVIGSVTRNGKTRLVRYKSHVRTASAFLAFARRLSKLLNSR